MTDTVRIPTPPTPRQRHHDVSPTPSALLWPTTRATVALTHEEGSRLAPYVWAVTRLSLASVFLWAFFDKLFGLGHETASARSWIHGGSPSAGFLNGAKGPFSAVYHSIAGNGVVNWVFMIGLLGIGVALLLGVGMRIAAAGGAVMVVLMWSASLPPANHIFMDDHIVYALVLLGLAAVGAGNTLGLGRWWTRTGLVRRAPWLT